MRILKQSVLAVAVAASMLSLAGCEKREVTHERRITVEVVSVDIRSKSNSRVDLRDVKTGLVYRGNRLSCGRVKAEKVRIGSKWDVTQVFYVYPESKRYGDELVGTSAICDKSQ